MKDKAEVLVEVERLRGMQAELNAELAQLHTALQRERSRNTDPRAKDKVTSLQLLHWSNKQLLAQHNFYLLYW